MEEEWPGQPSLFLFLYSLQRARDLRQEEMGFGGFGGFGEEPAAPNPAQQFVTLLHEGPDVGVHTVVWCATVTNLARSLECSTPFPSPKFGRGKGGRGIG